MFLFSLALISIRHTFSFISLYMYIISLHLQNEKHVVTETKEKITRLEDENRNLRKQLSDANFSLKEAIDKYEELLHRANSEIASEKRIEEHKEEHVFQSVRKEEIKTFQSVKGRWVEKRS